MLDSTGLSIVGAGEWAAAKHGGCGRRGWRKLHLGVDQSGVIRVHTLTEATGDDATTALDLLTAVEGSLVRVTADAAYDTVAVYERRCCMKPGFPISPWYRTHGINRRVLSLQGSDARSRTTEGDTWRVKKKTVRFSSHSTAC